MQTKDASLLYIIFLIAALVMTVYSFFILPIQIDDAYITYNFAQVFLESGEIKFSSGGEWVEGFSSPLFFILVSFVGWLSNSSLIPISGAVASSACVALIALVFVVTSKSLNSKISVIVFLGLLISNPGFIYYNITGLEAAVFSAFVCLVSFALVFKMTGLLLVSSAILMWVRPEAPWFVVSVLIFVMGEKSIAKNLYWPFLVTVLSLLALFLTRFILFRELLPNTFYAKSADYIFAFEYLFENLHSWHFMPYWLVASVLMFRSTRESKYFFFFALSWVVAVVLEGGDWMKLGRFLLPAAGLFSLSIAFSSVNLTVKKIILVCLLINSSLLLQSTVPKARDLKILSMEYQTMIDVFNHVGVQRVGLVDIGYFSLHSSFYIFDLAGLVSPAVAHLPGGHLNKNISKDVLQPEQLDVLILRLAENPLLNDGKLTPYDFSSPVEARVFGEAIELGFRKDFLVMPYNAKRQTYSSYMVLSNKEKWPSALEETIPLISHHYDFPVLIIRTRLDEKSH